MVKEKKKKKRVQSVEGQLKFVQVHVDASALIVSSIKSTMTRNRNPNVPLYI